MGNKDKFRFELTLDTGAHDTALKVHLLDYVGGWTAGGTDDLDRSAEWQPVAEFLENATVLLVPIDAAVLMESVSLPERAAAYELLKIDDVTEVVVQWAKRRNDRPSEPAMLVLVPVKCESYLAKAGNKDRADRLLQRVEETYGLLLKEVRAEFSGDVELEIGYCPVDTIGCVRLLSSEWVFGQSQEFQAHFGAVPPHTPEPRGADEILGAACRQFIAFAQRDITEAQRQADDRSARVTGRIDNASFLENVWWFFTNEDSRLRNEQQAARSAAADAKARTRSVADALRLMAELPADRWKVL